MATALATLPPSLRTNAQAQELALRTDNALKTANELRRKLAEMPLAQTTTGLLIGGAGAAAAGWADGKYPNGIMGQSTSLVLSTAGLVAGMVMDSPELIQAAAPRLYIESYRYGLKMAGYELVIQKSAA